jgi:hypothetical protein
MRIGIPFHDLSVPILTAGKAKINNKNERAHNKSKKGMGAEF